MISKIFIVLFIFIDLWFILIWIYFYCIEFKIVVFYYFVILISFYVKMSEEWKVVFMNENLEIMNEDLFVY